MNKIGPYLKTVAALVMSALTAAAPYYGSERWFTIITGTLTVIMVYLVPNLPKGNMSMTESRFGTPYTPLAAAATTSANIPDLALQQPTAHTLAVTSPVFTMKDNASLNEAMMDADVICGYFGGPFANRAWTDQEWTNTGTKRKLPMWVPMPNATAVQARENEIYQIVNKLLHYNIPRGQAIGFDLETSQADSGYMREMIACLHYFGMGIIAYGSEDTIAKSAGGAWVWSANWTRTPHIDPGAAGTQWESSSQSGNPYDISQISQGFLDYCLPVQW